MALVFALLVLFQIKHFLCDYIFQTEYHLGKFKKVGWEKPLASHCFNHAIGTFFLSALTILFFSKGPFVAFAGPIALALAALDFILHFAMDRVKASPDLLGRFEALSKEQYKKLSELKKEMEVFFSKKGSYYVPTGNEDNYVENFTKLDYSTRKLESNKYFWWTSGLDQSFHQLTDLLVVFLLTLSVS